MVPLHKLRPGLALQVEDAAVAVDGGLTASATPAGVEMVYILGWQTPESGPALTPLSPESVVIHRLGA